MTITLSALERDTLLSWKPESRVLLPGEEFLASKLKAHPGGGFELSDSQAAVLSSWAEAGVDRHFGAGAITNITEKALLDKIRACCAPEKPSAPLPENLRPSEEALEPSRAIRQRRKSSQSVLIVFILAAGVILYQQFMSKPARPAPQPRKASIAVQSLRVEYVEGEVSIKSGGSWQPLKIGMTVYAADSLKTAVASKAALSYSGGKVQIPESRIGAVRDFASN